MTLCVRCGCPANYYTETFDPAKGRLKILYLCKDCQTELYRNIEKFIREGRE